MSAVHESFISTPSGDLQLQLKMRSGEYCAARAGVTLVLYYAKPTHELAAAIAAIVNLYLSFIPEDSLKSMLSATGIWREFTKQSLSNGLRKLSAENVEYGSLHLSSGAPANVGAYGLHFLGSKFSDIATSPRETCELILEFPLAVVEQQTKQNFIDFVAAVVEVEPFESGYCGYAFKHLSETWRNEALSWIAQRAPRFLGMDISYDTFRRVARGQVVNVSWITVLGMQTAESLGGTAVIRERLSPEIRVLTLKTGLAVIAGEAPPVGDVNRGASDLRLVKEVASLTKPIRAKMEIGFGGEAFRRSWLSRLD